MTAPALSANGDLALQLAGQGWFVFPCRSDKRPYTAHGKDDATNDAAKIGVWWTRWPSALIGVYCEQSGFFAVDVDNKDGRDGSLSWDNLIAAHGMPKYGPAQQTPSGGYHYLFRYPDGEKIPNNANKLGEGLDLRSNGYICTGIPYVWVQNHGPEQPIPDAPTWLLGLIRNLAQPVSWPAASSPAPAFPEDSAGYWLERALEQAAPGNRNDTGFWLACQLRDNGIGEGEAESTMVDYARRVPGEGYTEAEAMASLREAFKSSAREPARRLGAPIYSGNGNGYHHEPVSLESESLIVDFAIDDLPPMPEDPPGADLTPPPGAEDKQPKKSQASVMVALALQNAELFHDADVTYARVRVDNHREVFPLHSMAFRNWMRRLYYHTTEATALGSKGAQDAVETLSGIALFDCPQVEVYRRIAGRGQNIYIDLCNDRWQVVEVTAGSWRILDNPPVTFVRPRTAQPLPTPQTGKLEDLRRFVNVAGDDWLLLVDWMLMAYNPKGPYPVLALHGEQGSGKSLTTRNIRRMIDPNVSMLRAEPRDLQSLAVMARHNWVITLENVSEIPVWMSDALCRLATGGGFSTRELYTDDEEFVIDTKRPTIVNGITDAIDRGDLLDRAIVLTLPDIQGSSRETEDDLNAEFEKAAPGIFGALLDALAGTLANLGVNRPEKLPRMADFAVWTAAVELALGVENGQILNLYAGNVKQAEQTVLGDDPLYMALIKHLQLYAGTWSGTASDLMKSLQEGQDLGIKNARSLSATLRRLAPMLRRTGVDIQFSMIRGGRARGIVMTSVGEGQ